ncbi:MAG TPA: Dabb family protein [Clostridia bacterium]|nr:Dabb family protein [Clostridia bacterium]
MVRHMVLFKLKEYTAENCNSLKDVLLAMEGNVPTVKSIEVRVDQLRSARSYDVLLSVDVDSWEALDEYQRDAYHCEVVKKYVLSVTNGASVTMDYEF